MNRDEILKQFLLHAAAKAKNERELDEIIEETFRKGVKA